jgi:hypothetical protein
MAQNGIELRWRVGFDSTMSTLPCTSFLFRPSIFFSFLAHYLVFIEVGSTSLSHLYSPMFYYRTQGSPHFRLPFP